MVYSYYCFPVYRIKMTNKYGLNRAVGNLYFFASWDYFIMHLQRKLTPGQNYICCLKSWICHLESSDPETFVILGNEMHVLCAMVGDASLSIAICTILQLHPRRLIVLCPSVGGVLCQNSRWYGSINTASPELVYGSWESHALFEITTVFPALWTSAGGKMAEC